jgi:O-antigen ligase
MNAVRSFSRASVQWGSAPAEAIRLLLIAALPFVILVVSPQRVSASIAVTAIYAAAAIWLRRIGKAERLTILFATGAAAFLALALLRSEYVAGLTVAQRAYGASKAFYMIAVVLPLSTAVALLVRRLDEFRLPALVFLVTGVGVSLLTLGLCDPNLLGQQRYVWQGNLTALGVLIALQFWAVPRFRPSLAAGLFCLAGVTAANSRQSVVAVATGLALTAVYWYFAARGREPPRAERKRRVVLPLVLAVAWTALLVTWALLDLRATAGASGLNWFYNPAGQCGAIAGRFAALSESTGGRSDLLAAGAHQVASNPLIGTGLGSFLGRVSTYEYPHNVLLEVAAELGLVGVIVLIVPFVVGAARLVAAGIRLGSGAVATLMAVVLIFAATASFSGDLPSARPAFIFGMLAFKFGISSIEANLEATTART